MDLQIAGRYRTVKLIAEGAFSEVFRGLDVATDSEVAIKLQSVQSQPLMLHRQFKLYKSILSDFDDKGLPQVYHYSETPEYNVMVLELLGPTLAEHIRHLERFNLKTVLMLFQQILQRLEFIHDKGLVHRDIKPDNFASGLGKRRKKIMLLDLGLAKRYLQENGEHVTYRDGRRLVGPARYASINNHLGIECTRRDDLESALYMCIQFLRGDLPWVGVRADNRDQRHKLILCRKMGSSCEDLVNGFPEAFGTWLRYARGLGFEERPRYKELREEARQVMAGHGLEYDEQFQWIVQEQQKSKLKE